MVFADLEVRNNGGLDQTDRPVTFHVDADSRFGIIKPPNWLGQRKAPGEIQLARSDLLQLRGRFEMALLEYDNLVEQIEDQAELLQGFLPGVWAMPSPKASQDAWASVWT